MPQELTFALLRLRSVHPEWWDFMTPYWDSLPREGEVLREQSFPEELLDLLQDDALVCTLKQPQIIVCQMSRPITSEPCHCSSYMTVTALRPLLAF